ncbi:MAG: GtrA family protein [Nocardioides sp.]
MSAVPDQTVSRLLRVVSPRHRRNWVLLVRFGLVGASGVLVNLVVLYTLQVVGPTYSGIWVDLPGTDFNVRWYHLFVTVAFLTANLWNFQLNRRWTFRSVGHGSTWWSEYLPFLVIGLLALGLNLGLVTLMIHPHSPLSLSSELFDDSSLLRSRLTSANLVAVALVTPVSFVLNKLWTFRSVRTARLFPGSALSDGTRPPQEPAERPPG